MSRAGSDPFVEQVRAATDIVALIGAQVELKRIGNRFRGLCPFHREKTPSFYVSPDHQSYHCFGCGEGGDAFSFLMDQEKMTFPEALRHLAERAGIPMPERRGPSGDLVERVRQALKLARGYYRERLLRPEGSAARAYLERREIGDAMAERFGLGVAPDAWDGLLSYARRFLSDRALVEAGLAIEGERGRIYDRFRNRLMIPIDSTSGTPVGFGGRILADEEPKYLNSPETAVYRKGTVLFGWPQARDAIRSERFVTVVEGYFDVIALAQAGLEATVGSCGTALTAEQAALLQRMGRTVVLLFDGDSAGYRAALRALPVVVGVVDEVRVAFPPRGMDPDLWVRQVGGEAVRTALGEARPPLAFLEEQVSLGALPKREAVDRAAELLARVTDPLHRELWLQEAASRFGLRVEAFLEKLGSGRPAVPAQPAPGAAQPSASREPWGRFEAQCLLSALAEPEAAGALAGALEAAGSRSPAPGLLRWIAELVSSADLELTPARILALARKECESGPALNALALRETSPPVSSSDLLHHLESRRTKKRMEAIGREIRRAEESGDQESLARLLAEKQGLARAQALFKPESDAWPDDAQRGEEP